MQRPMSTETSYSLNTDCRDPAGRLQTTAGMMGKMDVNLKIIEAVKSFPLLYKTAASIAERQKGWKQLAEGLEMQESFLKTRWYSLRERLLRCQRTGRAFKYREALEFLLPYIPVQQQQQQKKDPVVEPEFVITEDDIASEPFQGEDYVFMEVEELEEPVGEEHREEVNSMDSLDLREQLLESPAEAAKTPEEAHSPKHSDGDGADVLKTRNVAEKSSPECEATGAKQARPKRKARNESERGEDEFFGEVVAAMLKRMPADKKSAVKKDIMNLLLT